MDPGWAIFYNPTRPASSSRTQKKINQYKAKFPDVEVTADGLQYLGSFIGTKAATEQYVNRKEWITDMASSQQQKVIPS